MLGSVCTFFLFSRKGETGQIEKVDKHQNADAHQSERTSLFMWGCVGHADWPSATAAR